MEKKKKEKNFNLKEKAQIYQHFNETIAALEPEWTRAGTRFASQCQIPAFNMEPAQF